MNIQMLLALKAHELAEKTCKDAVLELEKLKGQVGEVKNCTDKNLEDKIVDAGSSFDYSWSSREWSARDSVVAAISGRVLDVVHLPVHVHSAQRWRKSGLVVK